MKKNSFRKKGILILTVFLLLSAVTLGSIKLYRVHKANQCGFTLAFDDYSADNWEEYFNLFDKYNVKVTFFITAYSPTDFCYHAIERGHEIAFHTAAHAQLPGLSDEEVYEQAIAPIEAFKEGGIELTTFAYPYGEHNGELDEKLLQYYNVLRGAWSYEVNSKHNMRKGFVECYSIDNINHRSFDEYQERIDAIIEELNANKAAVVGLYSHAIGGGDWCVGEERLEYLFQKAQENGIQFYTYKELQQD